MPPTKMFMDFVSSVRKIRACESEVTAQLVLEYLIIELLEAERERCALTCDSILGDLPRSFQ